MKKSKIFIIFSFILVMCFSFMIPFLNDHHKTKVYADEVIERPVFNSSNSFFVMVNNVNSISNTLTDISFDYDFYYNTSLNNYVIDYSFINPSYLNLPSYNQPQYFLYDLDTSELVFDHIQFSSSVQPNINKVYDLVTLNNNFQISNYVSTLGVRATGAKYGPFTDFIVNSYIPDVNGQFSSQDLFNLKTNLKNNLHIGTGFYILQFQYISFGTGDQNFSDFTLTFEFLCSNKYIFESRSYSLLNGVEDYYNYGYYAGEQKGYEYGYEEGRKVGIEVGKPIGYNEGVEAANQYTFLNLISACIDAPIHYFQSLFNFTLLGVNLQSFFTGLFTLCVIVVIIRLCLGGK